MDPSRPDIVPWSSSDLRAMLAHQLATPLACELDRFCETSRCSREQVSSIIESTGCRTFGELVQNAISPGDAARLVKNYAKASLTRDEHLPRDVARVLYILAILCGQQSGAGNVTSLDDASVEREARRCLTFGWLPDGVRESIRDWIPTG